MAINKSAIASQSVASMAFAVIDIVPGRPSLTEPNDPPETPGRIVGYFSQRTNRVELFVASAGGTFWLQAG